MAHMSGRRDVYRVLGGETLRKEPLGRPGRRWQNDIKTLRTGLLNCLNALSRSLTFRHRASCI